MLERNNVAARQDVRAQRRVAVEIDGLDAGQVAVDVNGAVGPQNQRIIKSNLIYIHVARAVGASDGNRGKSVAQQGDLRIGKVEVAISAADAHATAGGPRLKHEIATGADIAAGQVQRIRGDGDVAGSRSDIVRSRARNQRRSFKRQRNVARAVGRDVFVQVQVARAECNLNRRIPAGRLDARSADVQAVGFTQEDTTAGRGGLHRIHRDIERRIRIGTVANRTGRIQGKRDPGRNVDGRVIRRFVNRTRSSKADVAAGRSDVVDRDAVGRSAQRDVAVRRLNQRSAVHDDRIRTGQRHRAGHTGLHRTVDGEVVCAGRINGDVAAGRGQRDAVGQREGRRRIDIDVARSMRGQRVADGDVTGRAGIQGNRTVAAGGRNIVTGSHVAICGRDGDVSAGRGHAGRAVTKLNSRRFEDVHLPAGRDAQRTDVRAQRSIAAAGPDARAGCQSKDARAARSAQSRICVAVRFGNRATGGGDTDICTAAGRLDDVDGHAGRSRGQDDVAVRGLNQRITVHRNRIRTGQRNRAVVARRDVAVDGQAVPTGRIDRDVAIRRDEVDAVRQRKACAGVDIDVARTVRGQVTGNRHVGAIHI